MNTALLEQIKQAKIVAILRNAKEEDAIAVVEALLVGGLQMMEFTLNHGDKDTLAKTSRIIQSMQRHFSGKVHFGVGTVLTAAEAETVIAAGAEYIISPNTNVDVIRRTKELGVLSIPGAMTPSEIALAHSAGADIVKLFPAKELGLSYVKALSGPLGHIPLMATGGITADNIVDFLRAGCVGAGVGGNLINAEQIAQKNYAFVTKEAQRYTAVLSELR